MTLYSRPGEDVGLGRDPTRATPVLDPPQGPKYQPSYAGQLGRLILSGGLPDEYEPPWFQTHAWATTPSLFDAAARQRYQQTASQVGAAYEPPGFPERVGVTMPWTQPTGGMLDSMGNAIAVGMGALPGEQRGGTVDVFGVPIATTPMTLSNFTTWGREGVLGLITNALGSNYQTPEGATWGQDNTGPADKGAVDVLIDALKTPFDAINNVFEGALEFWRTENAKNRALNVINLGATAHALKNPNEFLSVDAITSFLIPGASAKFDAAQIMEIAAANGVPYDEMVAEYYDLPVDLTRDLLMNGTRYDGDYIRSLVHNMPLSRNPIVNTVAELGLQAATLLVPYAGAARVLRGVGVASEVAGFGRGFGLSEQAAEGAGLLERFTAGARAGEGATAAQRGLQALGWGTRRAMQINSINTTAGWSIRGMEWGLKQVAAIGGNDALVDFADKLLWEMPLSMNPGINIMTSFSSRPLEALGVNVSLRQKGLRGVHRAPSGLLHGSVLIGTPGTAGFVGEIGTKGILVGSKYYASAAVEAMLGDIRQHGFDDWEPFFQSVGWDRTLVEGAFAPGNADNLTPDDFKDFLLYASLEAHRMTLGDLARSEGIDLPSVEARSLKFLEDHIGPAHNLYKAQIAGESDALGEAIRNQFWNLEAHNDTSMIRVKAKLGEYDAPTAFRDALSYIKASKLIKWAFAEKIVGAGTVPVYRRSVNVDWLTDYRSTLEKLYPDPNEIVATRDLQELKTYGGMIEERGLGARLVKKGKKPPGPYTRKQVQQIIDDVLASEERAREEFDQTPREVNPAFPKGASADDPVAITRVLGISGKSLEALRQAEGLLPEQLATRPLPRDVLNALAAELKTTPDALAADPAATWQKAFEWLAKRTEDADATRYKRDTIDTFATVMGERRSAGGDHNLMDAATDGARLARDYLLNPVERHFLSENTWLQPRIQQADEVLSNAVNRMRELAEDRFRKVKLYRSDDGVLNILWPGNVALPNLNDLLRLIDKVRIEGRAAPGDALALARDDLHPYFKVDMLKRADLSPEEASVVEQLTLDDLEATVKDVLGAEAEVTPENVARIEAGRLGWEQQVDEQAGILAGVGLRYATIEGRGHTPEVLDVHQRLQEWSTDADTDWRHVPMTTEVRPESLVASKDLEARRLAQRRIEHADRQIAKADQRVQEAKARVENLQAGDLTTVWDDTPVLRVRKGGVKAANARAKQYNEAYGVPAKPVVARDANGKLLGYDLIVGKRVPREVADEIRAVDNEVQDALTAPEHPQAAARAEVEIARIDSAIENLRNAPEDQINVAERDAEIARLEEDRQRIATPPETALEAPIAPEVAYIGSEINPVSPQSLEQVLHQMAQGMHDGVPELAPYYEALAAVGPPVQFGLRAMKPSELTRLAGDIAAEVPPEGVDGWLADHIAQFGERVNGAAPARTVAEVSAARIRFNKMMAEIDELESIDQLTERQEERLNQLHEDADALASQMEDAAPAPRTAEDDIYSQMVRDSQPEAAVEPEPFPGLAEIEAYIKRTKTPAKKQYAQEWLAYRKTMWESAEALGEEPSRPAGLSYMAAQGVEMQIRDFMEAAARERAKTAIANVERQVADTMNAAAAASRAEVLPEQQAKIDAFEESIANDPNIEVPRPPTKDDAFAVEKYALQGDTVGEFATPNPRLDAAFEAVPPSTEKAVYFRSIYPEDVDRILAGTTYTHPGYMSTATTSELAHGYATGPTIRIEVPAGVRVIDVDEVISTWPGIMPRMREAREGGLVTGERLLPFGATFDVAKEGDEIILRMRANPTGKTGAARADVSVQPGGIAEPAPATYSFDTQPELVKAAGEINALRAEQGLKPLALTPDNFRFSFVEDRFVAKEGPGSAPVYGTATDFPIPGDETTRVPARFRVMELGDLVAQGDEGFDAKRLQPRERGRRVTSEQQIANITREFDPNLALRTESGSHGPQVVDPLGQVIAGNGRTLAMRALPDAKFAAYRKALADRAAEFGISREAVEGMDRPVLVREVGEEYATLKMATALNLETGRMTASEIARAMASDITTDDLAKLDLGEKVTLSTALKAGKNQPFVQRMLDKVGEQKADEYRSADGTLNRQGEEVINAAILQTILRDPDGALIETIMASDDFLRLRNGLEDAAGQLAQVEAAFVRGELSESMADTLRGGIEEYRALTEAKHDPRMGKPQTLGMVDQLAVDLGYALYQMPSRAEVTAFFREYAKAALSHRVDTATEGMFGAVEPMADVVRKSIQEAITELNQVRRSKAGFFEKGADEIAQVADADGTAPAHFQTRSTGIESIARDVPVIEDESAAISARVGPHVQHHIDASPFDPASYAGVESAAGEITLRVSKGKNFAAAMQSLFDEPTAALIEYQRRLFGETTQGQQIGGPTIDRFGKPDYYQAFFDATSRLIRGEATGADVLVLRELSRDAPADGLRFNAIGDFNGQFNHGAVPNPNPFVPDPLLAGRLRAVTDAPTLTADDVAVLNSPAKDTTAFEQGAPEAAAMVDHQANENAVRNTIESGAHVVVKRGGAADNAARNVTGASKAHVNTILEINPPDEARMLRLAQEDLDAAQVDLQDRQAERASLAEPEPLPEGVANEVEPIDPAIDDLMWRYMADPVYEDKIVRGAVGPSLGSNLGQVMDVIESIDAGVPPLGGTMAPEEIAALRTGLLEWIERRLAVSNAPGNRRARAAADIERSRSNRTLLEQPESFGPRNDEVTNALHALERMVKPSDGPITGYEGIQYDLGFTPKHDPEGRPLTPRILPALSPLEVLNRVSPDLPAEILMGRKQTLAARVGTARLAEHARGWTPESIQRSAKTARSLLDTAVGPRPEATIREQTTDRFFDDLVPPPEDGDFKLWEKDRKEAAGILTELHKFMTTPSQFHFGRFRKYRNEYLLPPEEFERIALAHVTKDGVEPPQWVNNFLARSGVDSIAWAAGKTDATPFWDAWRKADNRVRAYFAGMDGGLAKFVERMYDSGRVRGLSNRKRGMVQLYNTWRFFLDARWVGLEMTEAPILTFFREGWGATMDAMGYEMKGARMKRTNKPITPYFSGIDDLSRKRESWAWWMGNDYVGGSGHNMRSRERYLLARVKRDQVEAFPEVMMDMARLDPSLRDTLLKMGDTPEKWLEKLNGDWELWTAMNHRLDVASARELYEPYLANGTISQREFDDVLAEAARDPNVGFQYVKMPGLEAEVAASVGNPVLQPLMERLKFLNEQAWNDAAQVIFGQVDRSNAQRLLNHPLLYWPISYQIKATKWLAGLMFERVGGLETGSAGALLLDKIHAEHQQQFANDPEYQQFYKENSALMFIASMIMPITPFDIGVGLSPFTRLAISAATNGDYQRNIAGVGPGYTYFDLLPRLGYQLRKSDFGPAKGAGDLLGTFFPFKVTVGGSKQPASQIQQQEQQVYGPGALPPPTTFGPPIQRLQEE